jgi:hypothetical protein
MPVAGEFSGGAGAMPTMASSARRRQVTTSAHGRSCRGPWHDDVPEAGEVMRRAGKSGGERFRLVPGDQAHPRLHHGPVLRSAAGEELPDVPHPVGIASSSEGRARPSRRGEARGWRGQGWPQRWSVRGPAGVWTGTIRGGSQRGVPGRGPGAWRARRQAASKPKDSASARSSASVTPASWRAAGDAAGVVIEEQVGSRGSRMPSTGSRGGGRRGLRRRGSSRRGEAGQVDQRWDAGLAVEIARRTGCRVDLRGAERRWARSPGDGCAAGDRHLSWRPLGVLEEGDEVGEAWWESCWFEPGGVVLRAPRRSSLRLARRMRVSAPGRWRGRFRPANRIGGPGEFLAVDGGGDPRLVAADEAGAGSTTASRRSRSVRAWPMEVRSGPTSPPRYPRRWRRRRPWGS